MFPVPVATGLSPAQHRAYRIADKKTGDLADWNYELLVEELTALQKIDFPLDVMGFSGEELDNLFAAEVEAGLTDPDEVPAPPDEPVTQPGDVWQLGPHRLQCGDSSKPEDVDRLLEGAAVHVVVSAPPYTVRLEPRSN